MSLVSLPGYPLAVVERITGIDVVKTARSHFSTQLNFFLA
jgi:hypothetical protein